MEEPRKTTFTDPVMQKLARAIRNGWPWKYQDVAPEEVFYFPVRDELLVENALIQIG